MKNNIINRTVFFEKKEEKSKTKVRNNTIIYQLYKDNKIKYNPYNLNNTHIHTNSVIEVPKICFETKKAFKVGV